MDREIHNENSRNEILEWISSNIPTRILVKFDDVEIRDLVIENILAESHTLSHLVIDFSETQVTSLSETLKEKLSGLIGQTSPAETMIHVINLESSFPGEILSGNTALFSSIGETTLTEGEPFRWIFWIDTDSHHLLQAKYPSFLQKFERTVSLIGKTKPEPENLYEKLEKLAVIYRQTDLSPEEKGPSTLEIARIFGHYHKWTEAKTFLQEVISSNESENEDAETAVYISEAYSLLGEYLYAEQNYAEALTHLEKAQEGLTEEENPLLFGKVWYQSGLIHFRTGNYQEAGVAFSQAAAGYINAEDYATAGRVYNDFAALQEKLGDTKKALRVYRKSAEIWKEANNLLEVAKVYQHIGAINQNQRNWNEALEVFREALAAAKEVGNEFMVIALEDSVEQMEEKIAEDQSAEKKKGFFGRLFKG
ncbi:MAG: tetratricopeptide repeat protein [Bacteroidia bacterium]|nr:tetratricopeptide repeat protein [Bacteroidia bacterium]